MHDAESTSRFQLPRWATYIIGVAVVFGLCAGTVVLLGVAETRRWERFAKKLREGGDPLTFAEIEEQSSELPTERYAAQVLTGLAGRLPGTDKWDTDKGVLIFSRGQHSDRNLFQGIPRYTLPPTRAFLSEQEELLEELRTMSEMPAGRYVLVHQANPWSTLIQETRTIRTTVKLLYTDGLVHLCDGDIDGAIERVRLIARASATLDQHPTLIGRLVQISVDAQMLDFLEQVLRVAKLTDAQLSTLEDCAVERLEFGTFRWAILGERASMAAIFDGMVDGTFTSLSLRLPLPVSVPDLILRKNQAKTVEILSWLVEAGDDFDALRTASQRLDRTISGLPRMQFITRMIMPSVSRAVEIHIRIMAHLRCTVAGIAAERFRVKRGRLPTSLEELVPDFLDSVFTDPFTGDPLLLATTEKGIVIYSVGENLFDDGGLVAFQKQKPRYPDVGLRLFKPEHRGVFLTDEPRPEND